MSSEFTVIIDVVGRASARWRGAKSIAEAAEKNQQLSIRRATAVASIVGAQLRKDLPSINVVVTGPAPVVLKNSSVPVQLRGVGSHSPIIPEGPSGNASLNRSVMVTLSWVSAQTNRYTRHRPVKIPAPAKYWQLEVLKLDAAALVVGTGKIRFRLEAFGKTRRYEADLKGVGYDNPLGDFKDPSKPPPPPSKPTYPDDDPNPDKTYFATKEPVGFDAFDKNEIVVWKLKSGPGIPKTPIGISLSDTVMGFSGLGGDSDSIMIDWDVSLAAGISGYRLKGVTKAIDPDPGLFFDGVEYYDQDVRANPHDGADSIMVQFDTGNANINGQEGYIRKWASDWADKFKILNY
jgi:hypothetical protein